MKTVTIYRKANLLNLFRSVELYKNDVLIRNINNNEKLELNFNENDIIYVKIDWCRSNKLKINNDCQKIIVSSWLPNSLEIIIFTLLILCNFFIFTNNLSVNYLIIIFTPIAFLFLYMMSFGKENYLNLKSM